LYEKCVVSLDQVLWPVNYASKTKLHKNVWAKTKLFPAKMPRNICLHTALKDAICKK
jgi:hypothetical protein